MVFVFKSIGKPKQLSEDKILKILLFTCVNEGGIGEPMQLILWISDLKGRDLICETCLVHADKYSLVTFFYIPTITNQFNMKEEEVFPIVCISFIVFNDCHQGHGTFSKFTGYSKKFGHVINYIGSSIDSAINWSLETSHISLGTINDI